MLFAGLGTAKAYASSNKQELLTKYYHADGFIKAIGAVAHRTIYSSNSQIRHKWQRKLHYLIQVRNDAYIQLHTRAVAYGNQTLNYWIAKQIRVAEIIGHSSSSDPWPNCPDPIWNGAASWQDTVNCENGGNWYDSPGYYRCGLQFDPAWERIYGRLCP